MVTRPDALLLDEPTRGLDPLMKRDLGKILNQWKAQGKTILVVTHDVEFGVQIADRIALLEGGRIIADGLPTEVLSKSDTFKPQIMELFPGRGWLSANDVTQA